MIHNGTTLSTCIPIPSDVTRHDTPWIGYPQTNHCILILNRFECFKVMGRPFRISCPQAQFLRNCRGFVLHMNRLFGSFWSFVAKVSWTWTTIMAIYACKESPSSKHDQHAVSANGSPQLVGWCRLFPSGKWPFCSFGTMKLDTALFTFRSRWLASVQTRNPACATKTPGWLGMQRLLALRCLFPGLPGWLNMTIRYYRHLWNSTDTISA